MSELDLRIAIVAEGPTDLIVIEAALRSILDAPFTATLLQPEESVAFGAPAFGPTGTGWGGVYRWCKQVVGLAGSLRKHQLLFTNFDALVLHLDADVAAKGYPDASIEPELTDGVIPCERPCPPPVDSVEAIRAVLLSWANETVTPDRTVLCVPSKSTEAWVVAALFPNDAAVRAGIECHPDAESRLRQQPVKQRISKSRRDYRDSQETFTARWPALVGSLSQAARFEHDVRATMP